MLTQLTIKNIVLIDSLQLNFDGSLTVLTGETGAGKSILLDALGLALGARADFGLIRRGMRTAHLSQPVLLYLLMRRSGSILNMHQYCHVTS